MSLSNSVKLHVLDTITPDNSTRAVFRLPFGVLDSNITLIDLGVYDTDLNATTGWYNPHILGVIGCINRMRISVQGLIVDEVSNFRQWASIQARLTTNQRN